MPFEISLKALLVIIFFIMLTVTTKKTLYSFWNIYASGSIVFCFISLITKDFMYFALPFFTMMSLFLGISNIVLIKHEGFRIKNLVATVIGVFLVVSSVILLFMDHLLDHENFLIQYSHMMLFYLESIMLGFMIMGYISALQVPEYNKDYIIILGCAISKKGGLLPLLKGRTNRAIRYAWEQEIATGKPVKYVPSGGQGSDEVISEGSAMALYLESHGAESYEVITEKKSKNTWENFTFSRKLILENTPDAKVAFCTTNYHILRSGILARRAGFKDIEAISSTTKWYFWPNGFAREIVALLVMTLPFHLIIAVILFLTAYFS